VTSQLAVGRRALWRTVGAAAALLVLSGCAAEQEAVNQRVFRLDTFWTAGGVETVGGLELSSRPWAGAIGPGGGVAILDRMASRVTVLNSAGHVAYHMGSQGAGPGEFLAPMTVGMPSGSMVWVSDGATGRITIFETPGEVVRTMSKPFEPIEGTPWAVRAQWSLTSGGAVAYARAPNSEDPPDSVPIAFWPHENEAVQVADWIYAPGPSVRNINTTRGGPVGGQQFFDASPLVGVDSRGRWFFVVDRFPPQSPGRAAIHIARFSPNGTQMDSVIIEYDPVPVDESVWEWLRAVAQMYEERTRNRPAKVKAEDVIAATWVPEYLPPVTYAFADSEGYWLGRERNYTSEPRPRRFERYDIHGVLLGHVEIPSDLVPLAAAGVLILTYSTDYLDVPVVRLLEVEF